MHKNKVEKKKKKKKKKKTCIGYYHIFKTYKV